jgi:antitoxin component of MazEF toxin-antitoxin module
MKATIEKSGHKIFVRLPEGAAAELGLGQHDRLLARVEDGVLVVGPLPAGSVLGYLPEEDTREIALRAARRRLGDIIKEVDALAGCDFDGDPAWHIAFLADPADRATRGLHWIRIGQEIRDELVRRGDEAYPFVKLYASSEWHLRETARLRAR